MKTDLVVRIVDDDPSVLKSLSFMLKLEGLSSSCFASAEEFLAHDVESSPGCLILDVRMPGISGPDLFSELIFRKYPNPIIFLSAHGDIRLAVDMVKKGALDFIEKPVEPEAFISLVKKACSLSVKLGLVTAVSLERREIIRIAVTQLSEREKQILKFVLNGASNREVGERLALSQRTIEVHRASAYRKLNINSIKQLKELSRYFDWL